MKTIAVNKPNRTASAAGTSERLKQNSIMKKLLALAAVVLTTTFTAQAGPVSGYFRNNGTYVMPHYRSNSATIGGTSYRSGYTYRNPYAALPTVRVQGYTRSNGTFVMPHYRTPANSTRTDNLSYRGYGTIRVPRR